MHCKLIFWSPS